MSAIDKAEELLRVVAVGNDADTDPALIVAQAQAHALLEAAYQFGRIANYLDGLVDVLNVPR